MPLPLSLRTSTPPAENSRRTGPMLALPRNTRADVSVTPNAPPASSRLGDHARRHDAVRGARAAPSPLRGRVRPLEGPGRPPVGAYAGGSCPRRHPQRFRSRALRAQASRSRRPRRDPRASRSALQTARLPSASLGSCRHGQRALVGRRPRLARRRDALVAARRDARHRDRRSHLRRSARPGARRHRRARRHRACVHRRGRSGRRTRLLGGPDTRRSFADAVTANRGARAAKRRRDRRALVDGPAGAPLRPGRRACATGARPGRLGRRSHRGPSSPRRRSRRSWRRLGRFSDRRGRLLPLRFAVTAGAIISLAFAFADRPAAIVVLLVAAAIAFGAFWAPAMALLPDGAERVGLAQAIAFGLMNAAWGAGNCGALLGGALADAAGDALPYALMALVCVGTSSWCSDRRSLALRWPECQSP